MKKLISSLLAIGVLVPITVSAQQVNTYGVCRQYREVYTPGGYDQYGNYFPGGVSTQSYNVPCNQVNSGWRPSNQYYNNGGYYGNNYGGGYNGYNNGGYYGRRTNPNCNPTRTILGAVVGGAIGRSMTSTNNNRNNRGWATALGAGLGGLTFAC
jgi:hypothetical protein